MTILKSPAEQLHKLVSETINQAYELGRSTPDKNLQYSYEFIEFKKQSALKFENLLIHLSAFEVQGF